jgi:glyoxylase-like metal-dependent hydrolase (beta-lactamase superfamily II)
MRGPMQVSHVISPQQLSPGKSDLDRYLWARSPIEEVVDGVFRIPLPMPNDGLRAVNVYAIIGEDGLSLIDSGWAVPTSRQALSDGLGRLNASVNDIRQFLVTHLHPDHYAQASVLRLETGSLISLGADERPNLESILRDLARGRRSDARKIVLQRAGADDLLAELAPFPQRGADAALEWQPPDEWLTGGAVVAAENRRLRVVPTPGHTRGHVVYHDEQNRLLFSGDHILPDITPSLGLEPIISPWPLRDYMDSLRLIKARPDAMLLPAHGPVWGSAHRRVDQLLAHHEGRLNAALRAVEAGAATGWEVAQRLSWTYHLLALSELDLPNQAMAARETMAHLDVLLIDGALSAKSEGGIEYFSVIGGSQ